MRIDKQALGLFSRVALFEEEVEDEDDEIWRPKKKRRSHNDRVRRYVNSIFQELGPYFVTVSACFSSQSEGRNFGSPNFWSVQGVDWDLVQLKNTDGLFVAKYVAKPISLQQQALKITNPHWTKAVDTGPKAQSSYSERISTVSLSIQYPVLRFQSPLELRFNRSTEILIQEKGIFELYIFYYGTVQSHCSRRSLPRGIILIGKKGLTSSASSLEKRNIILPE